MNWICEHPGISNYYATRGSTCAEAVDGMAELLSQSHGGLASGMLHDCVSFDADDAGDRLASWLDRVAARGKVVRQVDYPVHGTVIELYNCDPGSIGVPPDVRILSETEDEIIFGNSVPDGYTQHSWSVTDLASDRWGNTYLFDEGPTLVSGCRGLWYSDDQLSEVEPHIAALVPGRDAEQFLEWARDQHPEMVDEVTEEVSCNGCSNAYSYWTTNRPMQEWRKLAREWKKSCS